MGTASEYAAYSVGLEYDDLPTDVVDHVKRLVLDVIGNVTGAYPRTPSSEGMLRGIRAMAERSGDAGETVLATGERLPSGYASMANAALAHSLSYDDLHIEAELHPSVTVVPAALGAAERVDADGEALITGIVAGYEVICRLGQGLNPPNHADRGFHPTSTCGFFGATAAAGSVLGLARDELEAAFGLNCSQASGTHQYLANGAWNKRLHPGLAVHGAELAVRMAREGFRGAESPIDGDHGFLRAYTDDPTPAVTTAGLGAAFETLEVAPHPYACCGFQHIPLDLLLEVAETHDVAAEDVELVTIALPTRGVTVVGRPTAHKADPRSFVDAQFSLPYGVALALSERDASVDAFVDGVAPDGDYDREFRRLMEVTEIRVGDGFDDRFPESMPTEVVVETTAGRITRFEEYRRGHPRNPMSPEDHDEKFEVLTAPVLPSAVRLEVRDRVATLETQRVAEVVELVAEARREASPSEPA